MTLDPIPLFRPRIGNQCHRKKVDLLSKEAISRVLAAEAEAGAIRERARADAAAMVDTCEAEQAAAAASRIEAEKTKLAARRTMVKERAEALILQSREEADGDIEALKSTARERMREAVKHIEWELTDI
jgi:hypothetical protein